MLTYVHENCKLTDHQVSCGMAMAYNAARFSPDTSTQNGAVILEQSTGRVLGTGVNRPPDGVTLRPNRPEKYLFTEHAERMAIMNAIADNGHDLTHSVRVCAWAACADCARAIITSGIRMLVRHVTKDDTLNDRWDVTINAGDIMFAEAGVAVLNWDGPLDGLHSDLRLLKNGASYAPYDLWKGTR